MNGEYIVSYDETKTWVTDINGEYIFNKKTGSSELINLGLAKEKLEGRSVMLEGKKYTIHIPNVIFWNETDCVLQLEYCMGNNLEFLLRDADTHKRGVNILNSILDFLINNRIYWVDFAPRNVILSESKIYIVDFEKGFMDEESSLVDVLRNHIYEEYCLFLFRDERKKIVDGIFDVETDSNVVIRVDSIKNNRIREIAKLLGYKTNILKSDFLDILRIIIDVEEPYIEDNKQIYPGVILDKYMINNNSDNPILDYSKKVLELHKLKETKNRVQVI